MVHNNINITYNNATVTLTPFGRKFTEANELITREERAADGTLRRDNTARKKRFTLAYDLIDGDIIELFEEMLLAEAPIKIHIERHTGNYDKYDVLLRPFDKGRESAKGKGLWSGFTAEFVEV